MEKEGGVVLQARLGSLCCCPGARSAHSATLFFFKGLIIYCFVPSHKHWDLDLWESFMYTEAFELQLCSGSPYMICQSLNMTNDQIRCKCFVVKWAKINEKVLVIPITSQIQFIDDKLIFKHIGGECALYLNSNIDIN